MIRALHELACPFWLQTGYYCDTAKILLFVCERMVFLFV